MRHIVIGSRESALAVVQAKLLLSYIKENCPDISAEILTMKTTGDIILDRTLDQVGGKGLFVKELDQALMDGRCDIAVHSLKDVPMEVPKELPLIGFSQREDERDVLVLPEGVDELDRTKPIGSSGKRRQIQLKGLYPHMQVKSIRGNVQTRLKKLDSGEYSALVLAAAGLKRLSMESRISCYFSPEQMLPAAGQGVLAIQGRVGEDYSFLKGFCHETTETLVMAERAFVKELDGGCSSPVAAHGVIIHGKCAGLPVHPVGEQLELEGLYYEEETGHYFREKMQGSLHQPEELGRQLAEKMRGRR